MLTRCHRNNHRILLIMPRNMAEKQSVKTVKSGKKTRDKSKRAGLKEYASDQKNQKDDKPSNGSIFNAMFIVSGVSAILFGIANSYHQYTMFENDRHFSHLSSLEREMTFRTEMGLYYSYFKTLVEAETFSEGLLKITHDRLTEYPNVINTLQRFNLYPEVIVSALYRIFVAITTYFNIITKQCWEVNRGDDLPLIESCEGLGEAAYFYITCVFVWNGLVSALIFLFGQFLSNSFYGGVLAAASFFFNHGESTRVQWTPPLRESFAYPIFLGQMLLASYILRHNISSWKSTVALGMLTTGFFLSWQFAQFALLTQTLSIFATYLLGFTTSPSFKSVLTGQLLGFLLAFILLFGNKMLLSSLFLSTALMVYIIQYLFPLERMQQASIFWNLLKLAGKGIVLIGGSLTLKLAISCVLSVQDDAHVWNILKSKFTDYKDFHTLLYTCAVEFDFMEAETPVRLTKTLILPSAFLAIILSAILMLRNARKEETKSATFDQLEDAAVVYNIFQITAFLVMAVLIMRLKLFFTPHLCIIASLVASRKHVWFIKKQIHFAVLFALLGAMSIEGYENLKFQRNILGEYSNPELEELLNWVMFHTPEDAIFAGSMPTMANLMLSARRAVVNHPHYEDADLRNRVYNVYKLYSRKPEEEVYHVLSGMGVDFAIIDRNGCYGRLREGCEMSSIWDIEDPSNRGRNILCHKLFDKPSLFTGVFRNAQYAVLKL